MDSSLITGNNSPQGTAIDQSVSSAVPSSSGIQRQTAAPSTNPVSSAGPISPTQLENWRGQGIGDMTIAQYMGAKDSSFGQQLQKINAASQGDPRAVTGYLNWRFYGDPNYSPASSKPGAITRILDSVWNPIRQAGLNVAQDVENDQQAPPKYQGESDTGALFDQKVTSAANIGGHILGGFVNAGLRGAGALANETLSGIDQLGGGSGKPFQDLTTTAKPYTDQVANSQLGQSAESAYNQASSAVQNADQYLSQNSPKYGAFKAVATPLSEIASTYLAGKALNPVFNKATDIVSGIGEGAVNALDKTPLLNRLPGVDWASTNPEVGGTGVTPNAYTPSPEAKAAIRAGAGKAETQFIDQSTPETKALEEQMWNHRIATQSDLGSEPVDKQIVGQHIGNQADYLVKAKSIIGERLGSVVKATADVPIDATSTYDSAVQWLQDRSINISEDGILNKGMGSPIPDADVPYMQKIMNGLRPDETGNFSSTVGELDGARKRWWTEYDLANSGGQTTYSNNSEQFVKQIRQGLLDNISEQVPQYRPYAQSYAQASDALRDFVRPLGYKGPLGDLADNPEMIQQYAKRSLSTAAGAKTEGVLDNLQSSAENFGYKSNVDTKRLLQFSSMLDKMTPKPVVGDVSDLQPGFNADVAEGRPIEATKAVFEKTVGKAYTKIFGIDPQARINAISELLASHDIPLTETVPMATKINQVLEARMNDNLAVQLSKEITADGQVIDLTKAPSYEVLRQASSAQQTAAPESGIVQKTPLGAVNTTPATQQPVAEPVQTSSPNVQQTSPTVNSGLTPEEQATGLTGGGGDNMPRNSDIVRKAQKGFDYIRNTEKAPDMGSRFAQGVEPSGQYMNMAEKGSTVPSGWEKGQIKFDNPLIVDWKSAGNGGWKTDLSNQFGGLTGKELSQAISDKGFDGIITMDGKIPQEIVSLKSFSPSGIDNAPLNQLEAGNEPARAASLTPTQITQESGIDLGGQVSPKGKFVYTSKPAGTIKGVIPLNEGKVYFADTPEAAARYSVTTGPQEIFKIPVSSLKNVLPDGPTPQSYYSTFPIEKFTKLK